VTLSSSVPPKPCSTSKLFTFEESLLLFVPLDDRMNFKGFVAPDRWLP
jgi:hypothetical protein